MIAWLWHIEWHLIAIWIVVAAAVYAFAQYLARIMFGPYDKFLNGIVIGSAKAFDNRSLQLRIERLSQGLEELKTINQKLVDNVTPLQAEHSTEAVWEARLDVDHQYKETKISRSADNHGAHPGPKRTGHSPGESEPEQLKATIGLAASDILRDQLNLASQIMNLEMLYERSLTDRLIGGRARLQAVLGFQISITPSDGQKNCVGVVEIAVRSARTNESISVVALIPNEKAYAAQSANTSSRTLGASGARRFLKLGLENKSVSRQLVIQRDSDIIAFERELHSKPKIFDASSPETVFGWEFRPVLGQSAVAPGMRQMLAVVALPVEDRGKRETLVLEIKTRCYWRRYNRRHGTSSRRWRLIPNAVDGSYMRESDVQRLEILNTVSVEEALLPRISKIQWVNFGKNNVSVIVKGANFFSGTKVLISGKIYSEGDRTLTLKSDQDFEFNTTIDGLLSGDAVLSGRFGPSMKLEIPANQRTIALSIVQATIHPRRNLDKQRISLVVEGIYADNVGAGFTVETLAQLPDVILCVGDHVAAPPYDCSNFKWSIKNNSEQEKRPKSSNCVRIGAWIPVEALTRNPSVTVRIPFCGADCQATQPLSFLDPTIMRLGGDSQKTTFRIAITVPLQAPLIVELDQAYIEGESSALTKRGKTEYRFEISTTIVENFEYLLVRFGEAETYSLRIPDAGEEHVRPSIDTQSKPPRIVACSVACAAWTGTGLDEVVSVRFINPADLAMGNGHPLTTFSELEFCAYDEGRAIEVYFGKNNAVFPGKGTIEFGTVGGCSFRVPIYIASDA